MTLYTVEIETKGKTITKRCLVANDEKDLRMGIKFFFQPSISIKVLNRVKNVGKRKLKKYLNLTKMLSNYDKKHGTTFLK